MNCRSIFVPFTFFIVLMGGAVVVSASQRNPSLVLFDFKRTFNIDSVNTSDAKVRLSEDRALRIKTGHKKQWPGIT